MKSLFVIGLVALLLGLGAPHARASLVTLQGETAIDSASVTLGHIFTGLDPAKAATVIANAPAPGERFIYDARTLAALAARYAIAWQPLAPTDRVSLTRNATIVSIDMVRDALTQALVAYAPAERFTVSLDQARIAIALPSEIAPTAQIENLTYDRLARRFEADVKAAAHTPFETVVRISGSVSALVEIPVLNRRLQSGDVIAEGDIAWVEIDSRDLRADSVTEAEALIGMTPRRALLADQPIYRRSLRAPVLIERGSLVTMHLAKPNLQISAQGRALANGGKGDLIRIQNLSSNRIVEAIVETADLVIVPIAQPAPMLSQGTP
jgi:flagella basal body P-ring formation protein FlgA